MNHKLFFTVCLLFSVFGFHVASAKKNEEKQPLVYVIPIDGPIESVLVYVVRRGVDEAVRNHADAIIFEMDTPGGAVSAASEIISIITHTPISIYTFVKKNAYSAGAIIALATPRIYMAPGSVIGAATPLMLTPSGGVQELPDSVEEKMTSAVAAMVRAAAEQGGHDTDLAEAMVRADLEYKVNGVVVSEKGRLLTLTDKEASQLVGDPARPLLSEKTVADLDALLETIHLPNAEKRVLKITPAEKLAQFITKMAPLLMILGLGGLFLEFKTPGFGLFGIGGILCLLLFFYGHYIAGLGGYENLVFFALGVGLLILEVFVIPGFGIAGISGLVLIIFSLINTMVKHIPGSMKPISWSMETFYTPLLMVLFSFVGAGVLVLLAAKFLPQTRLFKQLTLETVVGKPESNQELVGQVGIAHTDLRPSGSIHIDGKKYVVVTRGEYLERDQSVRVLAVHGNRIVVESSNSKRV